MVNISKKAIVISFPNDYMQDSFAPYLTSLGRKAKDHHAARVQYAYLSKALDFMRYVTDLPNKPGKFISTTLEIEIDGEIYSQEFKLVKPLNKENIFELRINLVQFNWRFRGIFFPYHLGGQRYYCFVFPFEKQQQVRFNLTDTFRDRASYLLNNLMRNP
jgi:hypothetical protein